MGVMLQNGGVYPVLGPAQALHLFARYYEDAEDPEALLELVGCGRWPVDAVAAAVGRRAAAAVAGPGPGGPAPRWSSWTSPPPGSTPRAAWPSGASSPSSARGVCVVLTTHELAEAERLADEVVIIDRGRKLAQGSLAELAAGTADGAVRFTTAAGLDTAALAAALGGRRHGHRGARRPLPPAAGGRRGGPRRGGRPDRVAGRPGPGPGRPPHRPVAGGGLPGHHRCPGGAGAHGPRDGVGRRSGRRPPAPAGRAGR